MRTVDRILGFCLVAVLSAPGLAATIHVTSGADATPPASGTLRDAVDKAQPGDTIEIDKNVQVKLVGELCVRKANVTIVGAAGAKIGQAPGANDPKLTIKANGCTVKDVTFTELTLKFSDASTGSTVSGCTFDGAASGVNVDGAKSTNVGTADSGNAFDNCTVGVKVKDSTDTTVHGNNFSKNKTAVQSTDDSNITVSSNQGSADKCVDVQGSSGSIKDNKPLTPNKKGGTGIDVDKSGNGTKGHLEIKGNTINVKGSANGILTHSHGDVTKDGNKVEGKTTGTTIGLAPGADAAPGMNCSITGNEVSGGATGIDVDLTAAPAGNVNVSVTDNVARKCARGIAIAGGAAGNAVAVTGNTLESCGAKGGAAVTLGSAGATVAADRNTVAKSKGDAVRVEGTSEVDVGRLGVAKASGHAVAVAPGAAAHMAAPSSVEGVKGASVAVGAGGKARVSEDFIDALLELAESSFPPFVDLDPLGPGSTGSTGTLANGQLTVDVPRAGGARIDVYGEDGYHKSGFLDGSGRHVVDVSDAPPGKVCFQVSVDAFPLADFLVVAEGCVDWKPPKGGGGGGGAGPLSFSATKVTFSARAGAEAPQKTVKVTNNSDATVRVTATIQATGPNQGRFYPSSRSADIAAGASFEFLLGFSAPSPGSYEADAVFSSPALPQPKKVQLQGTATPSPK